MSIFPILNYIISTNEMNRRRAFQLEEQRRRDYALAEQRRRESSLSKTFSCEDESFRRNLDGILERQRYLEK